MERGPGSPTPDEVRLQVARITAGRRFTAAPSLARFLNFIVRETTAGRGPALKEYLIGVDVFGRGETFDPRIDPIVRVQAGKLRKRLDEYYRREGASDEIIIDLPKGSYVPVFRNRGVSIDAPACPAATPAHRKFWRRGAVILALAVALSVAVWRLVSQEDHRNNFQFTLSRLTSDSGQTTHPAVSAAGRLLAFSSDRGPQGDSNIWVQPLAGGEALQLTRDPAADTSPDFSPDGAHVVFRSWRDGGGIYVVPVLGGPERRLAVGGYSPRFSPDGAWIAYAQDGIQVVPASGGEPLRVSGAVGGAACPLWTPDGKRLVFVGETPEGYDWWVASLARDAPPSPTGVAAALRKHGLNDFDETACPSAWLGNEIVVTLKVDGMGNLWKVPISFKTWKGAGAAVQLVPGPGVDHARVLASQGISFRLIFATDANLSHLWSLPVDAGSSQPLGDLQQLTRDASLVGGLDGARPILSADGDRLIFQSARSGNLDIWMKDLGTGREESLTSDPRPEDLPVADAAGNTVAYQVSDAGRQSIYLTDVRRRLPRKLCDDCAHPLDLSPDGTLLLYRGVAPPALNLLDVRTLKSVAILQDPRIVPLEASFSPGMKSIALVVREQHRERHRAFLVPFDRGTLGAADTWVPIAEEMYHLYLRWSPAGNLLYYFATRDDHRCLWALRFDARGRPIGQPTAVRHFHTVQHYPLSGSWILVARNRLAFNLTDVTSNIWMAAVP